MDCSIIGDLIPLYIDGCCSKESADAVKTHIEHCAACRELFEKMKTTPVQVTTEYKPKKLSRISERWAAVLQAVLLWISFAAITVGVSLEASTPTGLANGFWANTLVVPATGFMLSLTNWFFIRLYKNRTVFSVCSMLITLFISACAFIWTTFHYDPVLFIVLKNFNPNEILQTLRYLLIFKGNGYLLTALLCILSAYLSRLYAKLCGKE